MHTRIATMNDLPVLLDFEQGVIAAERPFDPTLRKGEIHYYDLETMLTDPGTCIVVAETSSTIVAAGYARIETAKPYLAHGQHAWLGFMFVLPDYRGQGINAAIIKALQQWSLSRNITEMRLEVYTDNTAAIRAYEKIGFTKLLVEMRLELK